MVLLALGILILDGFVTYLNIKEREQWINGSVFKAVLLDGLTSVAVGVSICVFVEFSWPMILPSTIGSMVGRYLAWKF